MTNHDKRQLKLMQSKIEQYKNHKINIGLLVNDLEGLLYSLESISVSWKELFHDEWFNLEQVFAVYIDKNDETILTDNVDIINSALENISNMILDLQ